MAEPSGSAEGRDFGGGFADAVSGGGYGGVAGGTSGAAAGGFGVTNPEHTDTAMAGMRPGFVDLRGLTLDGVKSLIENGWSIDRSGQFGFSPDMGLNVGIANAAINQGLSALAGVTGPFSGATKGMMGLGQLAAAGMRGLGATGTAQGFKGGTGEPGQTAPAQEPATGQALTPQQTAFTQNVLPPTGNPLLNMAPAAQQARPGWLNPYLGTYNAPQPASPASNQGLPSGQGLGPLYA